MAADKHRFEALDGLRGVAAGTILALHTSVAVGHPYLLQHGYLAVDLFFMLSGFVIGAAYERRLLAAEFPIWEMLKIRLVRLYPLIALGCLVGFVVAELRDLPTLSGLPVVGLVHGLTLWPALTPNLAFFQVNSVEWSLFWELAANLVHAAFVRRLSLPVLIVVMVVALAALAWWGLRHNSLGGGWGVDHWLCGAARVSFSYTAGLILFRMRSQLRPGPIRLPLLLLMAAIPIGVLVPAPQSVVGAAIKDLANIVVLYPILVWSTASINVRGWLGWPVKIAGDLSYPVYALQLPLIWLFQDEVANHLQGNLPTAAAWAVFLAFLGSISWVALRFYDEPVRRWLGRLLEPTRVAGVAPFSAS